MSRGEFVISQGWGTHLGLRALARIQFLRRVDTPLTSGAPVGIDIGTSLVADDEKSSPEPAV